MATLEEITKMLTLDHEENTTFLFNYFQTIPILNLNLRGILTESPIDTQGLKIQRGSMRTLPNFFGGV
jgi:hypothetical protein